MTKENLGLRVHILPLGFEFERAVAALMSVHVVDKAILVVGTRNQESEFSRRQETYTRRVTEALEERGITVSVVETVAFHMPMYIRDLTRIVKEELKAGNDVFINTSSSGRFDSMSAVLVGMAHGVTCYYVYADGYAKTEEEQLTYGLSRCSLTNPRLEIVPKCTIVLPKPEEALLLECLFVARENGKEWVEPWETAAVLHSAFPVKYAWNPPGGQYKRRQYRHVYASDEEKAADETDNLLRISFLSKFRTTFGRVLVDRGQIERDHEITRYRITEAGESTLYLNGMTGLVTYQDGKLAFTGR